ncbi:hypothetical protein GCM10010472_71880 [Pseudonocardia halophobica]|uniref:Uncharacterized protein n=1 Tax=Pseudonocardia halophobica TaxID=29401 RepID=A0A9W6L2K7_9PSEU|nr:hypothetical protein [Pseudonocardia halophobica]GLL10940.1 hypothetical protein GCM10017577_20810 [Pseudonocardia halophobica]
MLAAVVLVLLVVLAGFSSETGLVGAALLALVSVAWLLVNKPMEGVVLVAVSESKGLTGGDLAGIAGLVVAGIRTWQVLRARRRQR